MTQTPSPSPSHDPDTMADAVVARILARAGTAVDGPGRGDDDADGEQLDRADRAALRRVAGLSTELSDVSEVEYRQLRLERVVLAGIWAQGTAEDAEVSLRELAALAETAGSEVLDGVLQRRPHPDLSLIHI